MRVCRSEVVYVHGPSPSRLTGAGPWNETAMPLIKTIPRITKKIVRFMVAGS
jgi:hypothetical protein